MKKNLTLFILIFLFFVIGCNQQSPFQSNNPENQINTLQQNNLKKEVPTNYECRIDSDCNSQEYCSNNQCIQIACSDGEIVNHICKKYECISNNQCRTDEVCQTNKCSKLKCGINLIPQNHQCTYQILEKKSEYITPFSDRTKELVDRLTKKDYSENNFGKNLKEIYYYATSIKYEYDNQKWDVDDYWQTSDQTIEDGTGDCEDHAILLQSMIEYLLYKTYGSIPKEVSYILLGCVDLDNDGKEDGCHAWNIIDASKLPENSYTLSIYDTNKEQIPTTMKVIIGDVTINESIKPNPKEVVYTPANDVDKTSGLLAIYWKGRKWVELEPTWKMPLSYYESKGYPYVTVYRAFNSQEDYWYPDFINKKEKPTIFEDIIAYLFGFLKNVYNKVVYWIAQI